MKKVPPTLTLADLSWGQSPSKDKIILARVSPLRYLKVSKQINLQETLRQAPLSN